MALHTYGRDFTVTISGTTGSVQLEDWPNLGLIVPALDSTTLQLKVSQDNSTWYPVYDGGGVQDCIWAASTGTRAFSSRDLSAIRGYRYLQVVCGSAQNSAARTFTLTWNPL